MAKKEEGALMGALGTVVSILGTIEKVWEKRLLAEIAVKEVPTELLVTRQYKYGPDGEWTEPENKEEQVAIHRYITQPATVFFELGGTLNMGNYEMARVSAGVTVPCYREESGAAFAWAKDFVQERFLKEVADARTVHTAAKKEQPF